MAQVSRLPDTEQRPAPAIRHRRRRRSPAKIARHAQVTQAVALVLRGHSVQEAAREMELSTRATAELLGEALRAERHHHWLSRVRAILMASRLDDQVDLTPRERQILGRVMDGVTVKEIAFELGIGAGTVRHRVHRILAKYQIRYDPYNALRLLCLQQFGPPQP